MVSNVISANSVSANNFWPTRPTIEYACIGVMQITDIDLLCRFNKPNHENILHDLPLPFHYKRFHFKVTVFAQRHARTPTWPTKALK